MRRIFRDPRTGKIYKKRPRGAYLRNGLHVKYLEEVLIPEDVPFTKVMPQDRIVPAVDVDNSKVQKIVPQKNLVRKELNTHVRSLGLSDRIVSALKKNGINYKKELEDKLKEGSLESLNGIGKRSLSKIQEVLERKQ